jgi:hypothetical protein
VHRCVDVPSRAALRRLPEWVIALTAADRPEEMRLATAILVSPPERDQ